MTVEPIRHSNEGQTRIHCSLKLVLGLQSIIHKTLLERHRILSDMIGDAPESGIKMAGSSVVGRVFPLVPYRRFLNGMAVSKVSRSEEDIQDAFESALKGQALL